MFYHIKIFVVIISYVAHKIRELLWKDGYWRIEINPKMWKSKARYLIENILNRQLEKNEKVIFKDKNRTNCIIENLEVIDYKKKVRFSFLENGTILVKSNKTWCRDYDYCIICKRDDRRHGGKGECGTCYARRRYQQGY